MWVPMPDQLKTTVLEYEGDRDGRRWWVEGSLPATFAEPVVYPDGEGDKLIEVCRILPGNRLIHDDFTETSETPPARFCCSSNSMAKTATLGGRDS